MGKRKVTTTLASRFVSNFQNPVKRRCSGESLQAQRSYGQDRRRQPEAHRPGALSMQSRIQKRRSPYMYCGMHVPKKKRMSS